MYGCQDTEVITILLNENRYFKSNKTFREYPREYNEYLLFIFSWNCAILKLNKIM